MQCMSCLPTEVCCERDCSALEVLQSSTFTCQQLMMKLVTGVYMPGMGYNGQATQHSVWWGELVEFVVCVNAQTLLVLQMDVKLTWTYGCSSRALRALKRLSRQPVCLLPLLPPQQYLCSRVLQSFCCWWCQKQEETKLAKVNPFIESGVHCQQDTTEGN